MNEIQKIELTKIILKNIKENESIRFKAVNISSYSYGEIETYINSLYDFLHSVRGYFPEFDEKSNYPFWFNLKNIDSRKRLLEMFKKDQEHKLKLLINSCDNIIQKI